MWELRLPIWEKEGLKWFEKLYTDTKVVSCCCFNMTLKLIGDVQENKDELEAGGLEYEDKEVEAFHCSLILRNQWKSRSPRIMNPILLHLTVRRSTRWSPKRRLLRRKMVGPWSRMKEAFAVMWEYLLLQCRLSQSQSLPL